MFIVAAMAVMLVSSTTLVTNNAYAATLGWVCALASGIFDIEFVTSD
jgi:hypothetical protein